MRLAEVNRVVACVPRPGPSAASRCGKCSTPATFEILDGIVRDGAYVGLGMPAFPWLAEDDVTAIRSFILARRAELSGAEP